MAPPTETIHLHPTAEVAERVLLPGDPGRALRLAQALLVAPKMLNHNRGLWGYSGEARADGAPLTIQSTGMGGPSTAIVTSELITLGARRLLRVGTCGALAPLELGWLLIATEAISDDGTSQALGAGERVPVSPELLDALRRAALRPAAARTPTLTSIADGPVVSTDLFYDAESRHSGWRAAGALAVEMEAATLMALARRRGVSAGCALVVSDTLHEDPPVRIDPDALHAAERELGELAVAALPPV